MGLVDRIAEAAQNLTFQKMEAERDEAIFRADRARHLATVAEQEAEFNKQRARQAKAEADDAEAQLEIRRIFVEVARAQNAQWLAPAVNSTTKGSS